MLLFSSTTTARMPRPMLVISGCLLLALLLAGGSVLAGGLQRSPRAFAATRQVAAGTTCAQTPTMEHCHNQDPQLQGCAADAQTLSRAEIKENGFTIGSVERRWSLSCRSWWGRVFDQRPGSHTNMFLTIAGTTLSASPTFVGTHYRILYGPMVFAATPTQQVPEIIGTLEIDGITTPPSATLPAITIPDK